MYIIKNAIKNLERNKGRNALAAIIVFAIILTSAVSIIINTTTAAIIEDYKSRFGSEVSITFDTSKGNIPIEEYQPLTPEMQISFGESEYLQSKTLSTMIMVLPTGLHTVDEVPGQDDSATAIGPNQEEIQMPTAKLIGSTDERISTDFENGLREIAAGEIYKKQNECLISEQLAELNHLSIGDEIEIQGEYKNYPYPQKLNICGIYSDQTMLGDNIPEMYQSMPYAMLNRNNEILVSFETATALDLFKKEPYFGFSASVDATFYLKEPSLLESFKKEVQAKGLPDYYKVTTDEAGYNKIVGPVEGLAKITDTFLAVVLVLGAVILVLLSVLSVRERKYEIGVLRAMGMKKWKVALGLLTESLVITALCLCLGLAIGQLISQPIADSMLENQIEAAQQNTASNSGNIGMVNGKDIMKSQKPLSEIDVTLNGQAILEIGIISLALAAMSSLVGILYITKYEPMKILSERN